MGAARLRGAPAGATAPARRQGAAHHSSGWQLDPQAKRLMAEGLRELQHGDNTAAIAKFNKAARRQGSVDSYFLLGWAHYQRGFKTGSPDTADRDDAQSAIDAYTVALRIDPALEGLPDPSRLHFSMALCYEAVGAYDRAIEAYKSAFRAAPTKALIALNAARLRLKMGETEKAEKNVQIALNKALSSGQGRALRDAARYDRAFAPLLANTATRKALELELDNDADAFELAAVSPAAGEELRDSVRDTGPSRRAPAGPDQRVLDKMARGNLEYQSRRYLSAVTAFNDALALNQEQLSLSPAQLSQVYERIGNSYNKLGQAETAIAAFQRSLEQSPANPMARYQLALAYGMAGKTAMALDAVRESLRSCFSPDDLRKLMMGARTDTELEAARDLPGFQRLMAQYNDRARMN